MLPENETYAKEYRFILLPVVLAASHTNKMAIVKLLIFDLINIKGR
jgi:hypothetical protein